MIPIKKLQALYWAEVHMREARDTCVHLIQIQNPGEELRHCIYTGIVVSYARSFGANQGMSEISSDFRKFTDPKMQALHDGLLEARNTMFAHRDLIKEGARLAPSSAKVDLPKIEIDISSSGQSHWIVRRPVLPSDYLTDIVTLCDFQMGRLNKASSDMLANLCVGKPYSPGRYELGASFP